jgi:predicted nucleotidyltransferase
MQLTIKGPYSHEMQKQLKDSIELLKTILGPDLLGVYLYGSSIVGGLQKYSDIDLLVVTNRATTSEEKAKLIASLLQISGIYMKSSKLPIEITLVEKRMINP